MNKEEIKSLLREINDEAQETDNKTGRKVTICERQKIIWAFMQFFDKDNMTDEEVNKAAREFTKYVIFLLFPGS